MAKELTLEQQLAVIRKAWGNQSGYAFFPWISGEADSRETRIKSYHEGPAFMWPEDKDKILTHMASHTEDDLYWCPSLFERKMRRIDFAMDEHALWADLDEVDPNKIQDYPPTIAWETSPNRYQALWLITGGDMQGASWQGGENQRLTYYLGADASGWDSTQLMRIPGWRNHKIEYRKDGDPPQGKLLWHQGRRYLPDEFGDLPEVQSGHEVQTVLEEEIDRVDRHEVWARVKLKLPKKARELYAAREASGDKSSQLWWLMRCLADVGCTATEIVAVVRETVWNKFVGRQDELKRLTIEASKAIAQRSEEKTAELDEEREAEDKPAPQNIFSLVENVSNPEWLVNEILAKGSCGFIAGQPKSYKSWVALDLILSVATGIPFLDHFPIRQPGPVLYVQEEDPLPTVKQRLGKVWPGKRADKMRLGPSGVEWHPADEVDDQPPINAVVQGGVVISDGAWQSWLDDQLSQGYGGEPYVLLVIDPLMMVAGEVDENRAQEMTTKIFKPLKQLASKHKCAILVVHHMKKSDPSKPQGRGGQLMLGSVANHAWSEDSLYLRLIRGGHIVVERESKHTTSGSFKITNLRNKKWTPQVTDDRMENEGLDEPIEVGVKPPPTPRSRRKSKALTALEELGEGWHKTGVVAEKMGVTSGGCWKQLMRLTEADLVVKSDRGWSLAAHGS